MQPNYVKVEIRCGTSGNAIWSDANLLLRWPIRERRGGVR